MRGESARRSCAWLRVAGAVAWAAALTLLFAPARADGPPSLLLAEPRAQDELAPLASGHSLWLARRIEAAGLSVESAPAGDVASALEQAAARGAPCAMIPDLRLQGGVAQVRLRLYATGAGELLAAPGATAPLASIGDACEQTAQGLLLFLGAKEPQRARPRCLRCSTSPPPAAARCAGSSAASWPGPGGRSTASSLPRP